MKHTPIDVNFKLALVCCASVRSAKNINTLSLIGMQLPEKYFDFAQNVEILLIFSNRSTILNPIFKKRFNSNIYFCKLV
jgi:hypothetical protein